MTNEAPESPVRPVYRVERGLESVSGLLGGLSVLAIGAAIFLVLAWLAVAAISPTSPAGDDWFVHLGGAIGHALFYALLFHAGSHAFAYMASMHRMRRSELANLGIASVPDEARCPRCSARVLAHDRGCRKCNLVFERTLAEVARD